MKINHSTDQSQPIDQTSKTILFYYTGTGNSLWAARVLARELGHCEVISMLDYAKNNEQLQAETVGLIFPVHMWGVPHRVLDFLDQLQKMSPKYIFAIANNAGQVSNTLIQLKKEMQMRSLNLDSGWSIVMPSNYIPWGGPGSQAEQNELFSEVRLKLTSIANDIRSCIKAPLEKGPLWQRIIFTWIYKLSFPHVAEMDSKFWVDQRCNQCRICQELCPNHNIILQDGKLLWQNNCEQCLACIQWCPQEALQYGKKTAGYARYHHPEVKLKDLLKSSQPGKND